MKAPLSMSGTVTIDNPRHDVLVMAGPTAGETYIICRKCPDGGTGLGLSYARPEDRLFEVFPLLGPGADQLADWLPAHSNQDRDNA